MAAHKSLIFKDYYASNGPCQRLCRLNSTCQVLVWNNKIHVPLRVKESENTTFPLFELVT